jgi:hypothetical protein
MLFGQKLALHFWYERRWLQTLRESEAKAVELERLGPLWSGNAADACIAFGIPGQR